MDGQPVWLASVSVARFGRRIGTAELTAEAGQMVRQLLFDVMEGVGDLAQQRLFRMNVTTCLHRAASAAEVATLPERFHTSPAIGIAGGPVEVLWETVPGKPSTRPCEKPARRVVNPRPSRSLGLRPVCALPCTGGDTELHGAADRTGRT